MNKEQIDLKIENKLISKIANHRLMARETFRNRHKNPFPEVGRGQCSHHINELRVWLKIAQLIDEAKHRMPNHPVEPYETYYAKELTK
tara:strand:- start:2017 stop:2280 length:264 start_codon:yes stop_codon:yes gene_type:complete